MRHPAPPQAGNSQTHAWTKHHDPHAGPDAHERYHSRELSWLAFNRRVLEEAADPATPLIERAKFLAIVASNLDEFAMVRLAELRVEAAAPGADPALVALRENVTNAIRTLVIDQYRVWQDEVRPALAREELSILLRIAR